jgi:hypothetical protein
VTSAHLCDVIHSNSREISEEESHNYLFIRPTPTQPLNVQAVIMKPLNISILSRQNKIQLTLA